MFHIIKLPYMAYQFIYLTKSGMTFYGKYDQYAIYFRIIIPYIYISYYQVIIYGFRHTVVIFVTQPLTVFSSHI